jgi:hypothetical protein
MSNRIDYPQRPRARLAQEPASRRNRTMMNDMMMSVYVTHQRISFPPEQGKPAATETSQHTKTTRTPPLRERLFFSLKRDMTSRESTPTTTKDPTPYAHMRIR